MNYTQKQITAIKNEIIKDIEQHSMTKAVSLVNWFYNNYANSSKFNEFLLLTDRYTTVDDTFKLSKKLDFLLENRQEVLRENLFEEYGIAI